MEEEVKIQTEPSKTSKTRHRSPNYPAIGLRSAVEKINAIYSQDGIAVSTKTAVLQHLGFDKAHGEAGRVLSALRSFGLIEENNHRIKLTQRGVDIAVRQPGDPERDYALKEAMFSPEIYRELLKEYKDSGLPSDTALRSEMIAVKRFNPNAVSDFLKDFRDSLEFTGLSDIRVLDWNMEAEEELSVLPTKVAPKDQAQVWPPRPPFKPTTSISEGQILDLKANMRQDVFSLTEGVVTIQWPASLSAGSFEDLGDWLNIVKRKIGRSISGNASQSNKLE